MYSASTSVGESPWLSVISILLYVLWSIKSSWLNCYRSFFNPFVFLSRSVKTKNVAQITVQEAGEHLQPDPERRKHKKAPIKIVVVLSEEIKRAGQSELANVFNNHLNEIRQTVGKEFIFATNNDKTICDFQTIGLTELGDRMGGKQFRCPATE